jgi:hypothetical protein
VAALPKRQEGRPCAGHAGRNAQPSVSNHISRACLARMIVALLFPRARGAGNYANGIIRECLRKR